MNRAAGLRTVGATNRLGVFARLFLLVVSAGLLTLLLVARTLSPSESGLGTHQQLGLPPCSIRVLYGMRCPACGMTTSWALWTRGAVYAAWNSSAGGVVLAVLATVGAPAAAWIAIRGRTPSNRALWIVAASLTAVLVITAIDWLVRIA